MSTQAAIAADLGSFASDPLRCVKYSFPWGESGPLADYSGPREWQADVLRDIRDHLQGPDRFQPLQIAIASGHGIGKALAHGEPVLTPFGWVPVESLRAGEMVIAGDGTLTRIVGVFPQGMRDVFRVTTDDGGTVLVDGDHQWFTTTRSERKHGKLGGVRTTKQIAGSLTFPNGPRLGLNHQLPINGPVAFSAKALPIDPYIFGCWLGDGDANGRITGLRDSFLLLERAGAKLGKMWVDKRSRAVTCSVLGIRPALRSLGVYGCKAQDKWIPESYLRGSIEQRLALLQGLMDTDGSANGHGAITFEVVSEKLADGMQELVRSLGGVVRRTEKMGAYAGKQCRLVYRLFLSLPGWMVPFRCPEKLNRYKPQWAHRNCYRTRQRFIRSVEPVGKSLATCIAVSHPSCLFVTRDYIVTHNTALIAMVSHWAMSTMPDTRVMVTANTEDQLVTKTWPEMSKWFGMAINQDWWTKTATRVVSTQRGHEDSWRLDRVTWSENNTEAFQGLHNLGRRIVVIFEEASGIPPKIWQVTQGALTDKDTEIIWLAFGNPTQNTGDFRECFGKMAHRWKTRHIDARTVPGTNRALFDKWIEDYGEDSDFVRVRVRGEFPRAGSSQFIPQDLVADARRRHVAPSGWPIISVDVARFGSNQTVILLRRGDNAIVLERGRGWDTQQTAMRVEHHIIEQNARVCIIDGDGIGGAVADKIRTDLPKPNQPRKEWPDTPIARWYASHTPFQLQEFHGAAPAADPFMYRNRRAEVWGAAKKWLKTGDIPDEPEFEEHLTGVEYWYTDKFTIQLERKEDMEARGLASPDNGDALAMSFAAFPLAETREEKVIKEQAQIKDPMALHFAKLAETERRIKAKQPKNYWD